MEQTRGPGHMRPLPPGHLQSLNAPKAEGASRLLWGRRGPARPWARLLATQWDRGGPGRSGRLSGSPARPAPPRVDALQVLTVHRRGCTAVSFTWPSSVSLALSAGRGVATWPPGTAAPSHPHALPTPLRSHPSVEMSAHAHILPFTPGFSGFCKWLIHWQIRQGQQRPSAHGHSALGRYQDPGQN